MTLRRARVARGAVRQEGAPAEEARGRFGSCAPRMPHGAQRQSPSQRRASRPRSIRRRCGAPGASLGWPRHRVSSKSPGLERPGSAEPHVDLTSGRPRLADHALPAPPATPDHVGSAGIQGWHSAVAATWGRWAGWREWQLASGKNAWWRHVMRRDDRRTAHAVWDGGAIPYRHTVDMCEEKPWQEHARDREAWKTLDQAFIARVPRKSKTWVDMVLLGRRMIQTTLEPEN